MHHSTGYGYYIALPANSICSILATVMTIHLCCSIHNQDHKKKQSSIYYTLHIISVISSTFGIYIGTLRFYLSYFLFPDNLLHNKYINILEDIFHFLGAHVFYIIALLKIKDVFSNTSYSMNTKTSIAIISLIILQICFSLWFTAVIFYVFFIQNQTNETVLRNFDLIRNLPTFGMLINSFILNSTLIILFVYKLRQVISTHVDANINIEPIINTMVKQTILFGIAIFTNELFYVTLIVNKFTSYHGWYVFVARCAENLSNISALYLSLNYNRQIYYKICATAHKITRMCCIKTIKNKSNEEPNQPNINLCKVSALAVCVDDNEDTLSTSDTSHDHDNIQLEAIWTETMGTQQISY